jgi:hypothetical protein
MNKDLLELMNSKTPMKLPQFDSYAALVRHLWTFIPWMVVARGPLTEELFNEQ